MRVTQASMQGPYFFLIYLIDLFYLMRITEVSNYVDDKTYNTCDLDLRSLITRLEHNMTLAIEWFESNYMKVNQVKN